MLGDEPGQPWSPERVAIGILCLRQAEADRDRQVASCKPTASYDVGGL